MKGYYKRAKAHAAVWNEKEARRDYNMVAHLDVTLASLVNRELRAMSERMKEKYWEEKEKYWNMLETREKKNKEEEEEEEEGEDKGKQEDNDSVAAENKDVVGEEKGEEESPSKCAEGHKEELLPVGTGDKEEASPSETNPDASDKSEGKGWQHMLRLVMLLQNEGNFLMKKNRFQDASAKFKEAIEYVDALQKMVSVIAYILALRKSVHRNNNAVFSCQIKPSVTTLVAQRDDADHINGLRSEPFIRMSGWIVPGSKKDCGS